jgi:hypothetical protein
LRKRVSQNDSSPDRSRRKYSTLVSLLEAYFPLMARLGVAWVSQAKRFTYGTTSGGIRAFPESFTQGIRFKMIINSEAAVQRIRLFQAFPSIPCNTQFASICN